MNSLNTIRQFGFAHLAKEAPRIHHDGQNLKITMLVSMICDIAINQLSYFNHHRKESPSLSPAKLTRQWHYDVVKSINAARYAATQLKARLAEKSLELTTYNPFKFIANLLRKVAYKKLISELCRAIEAFDKHSKPENPPMDYDDCVSYLNANGYHDIPKKEDLAKLMHKEEIRLDDQDKISEKTNINRFNSAVLKFIDKSWNPPSPYSPLPFIKLISPATIIETLTPLEPIGRGTPTPYLPPNLEATRPANSSAFGGGMHF